LVYKKTSGKIAFGKFFFLIVTYLELRLNVLAVRMRFASKLLESNALINKGFILVNGRKKSISFLTCMQDIIQKKKILHYKKLGKRIIKKKWQA
jgi:ribosomal protein S4